MVGWGGGAAWGGLVVMILAMAGFWALVVGATMALFRGAHHDPAVRRRRSGAVKDPGRARDVRVSCEKQHQQGPHAHPEFGSKRR